MCSYGAAHAAEAFRVRQATAGQAPGECQKMGRGHLLPAREKPEADGLGATPSAGRDEAYLGGLGIRH